ncbi:hypothetical protein [Rheinheimera sediminis]|uniref:hypothetical protein n=1 Tax=Rheinheimera sp. YQF-1 TaxID=2499626 RepID=UPI0016451B48|nr:hypothetical protein [Rheinheimera sp. YQF-1]
MLIVSTLTFYDHPKMLPYAYSEPVLDWLAEHISLPGAQSDSMVTRKIQQAFYAIGKD